MPAFFLILISIPFFCTTAKSPQSNLHVFRGFLLIIAIMQGIMQRASGQNSGKIVGDLVRSGFENTRYILDGDKCFVSIENHKYRWDIMAISKALDIIASGLDESVEINLLVLENDIPQKLVIVRRDDWKDFSSGKMDPASFAKKINMTHRTHSAASMLSKAEVKNRSRNKLDLIIYPQFYFENTLINKFYETQVNIAPALEFSLWKGNRFTGQVIFPIQNNLGYEGDHIRPGIVSISQELRLCDNLYSRFTAGNLPGNIYGFVSDLSLVLFDGHINMEMVSGIIGSSFFLDGEWVHSPINRFTGSLSVSWFWSYFNMEIKAGGARFVNEDYGVFASCLRHFNETSVGLYFQTGQFGNNGGFFFSVPLPFKRRPDRKFFRISIPAQYGFTYNAGTYNFYGQSLRTETNSIYKDRFKWGESNKNMITNLKNNSE